jgi:prepilin-type N-terminal cleavage/methylation domain-containing protein
MTAHDQSPVNQRRDLGFTLIEMLICVSLLAVLVGVMSSAIIVTLRTSPAVEDRADAAVNLQGLVTWLPQDVDSAAPGKFDVAQTAASGCLGTDPGFNVLKLSWSEQISSTTNYVASYRYVAEPGGGRIVRVYCVVGTAPRVREVTGLLPAWTVGSEPVHITLSDSPADADTLVDSATVEIEPIAGKTIVIDATTKNPNETLPTSTPSPTNPPPPAPVNRPPVAADTTSSIDAGKAVTISLAASDPDGDALTVSVGMVPSGWTISANSGTSILVTAPVAAAGTTQVIPYTVTDSLSASASANVTINVIPAIYNQPPLANPATASTTPATAVTILLPASDPEGKGLTTTFSGVPTGWTATAVGLSATITPSNVALPGTYTFGYTVTDSRGQTSSSTIAVTVTPGCVINTPVLSRTSVGLKKNNPDALASTVDVSITIVSGYCVGLALNYDTGAPNGQYVRNFGTSGTMRTVTLPKNPSPELWAAGPHQLVVKDGSGAVLGAVNLQVTL